MRQRSELPTCFEATEQRHKIDTQAHLKFCSQICVHDVLAMESTAEFCNSMVKYRGCVFDSGLLLNTDSQRQHARELYIKGCR